MKYRLYSTQCFWDSQQILKTYPKLKKLDISIDKGRLYINSNNLEETLSNISEYCGQCEFVINIADNAIEIYDGYRE